MWEPTEQTQLLPRHQAQQQQALAQVRVEGADGFALRNQNILWQLCKGVALSSAVTALAAVDALCQATVAACSSSSTQQKAAVRTALLDCWASAELLQSACLYAVAGKQPGARIAGQYVVKFQDNKVDSVSQGISR